MWYCQKWINAIAFLYRNMTWDCILDTNIRATYSIILCTVNRKTIFLPKTLRIPPHCKSGSQKGTQEKPLFEGVTIVLEDFPDGASGKKPAYQYRRHKRHGLDPWVRKIPWRRVWWPTPVFLSGESPWTEEPGGLQSMGSQRVGHDWATHIHSIIYKSQL